MSDEPSQPGAQLGLLDLNVDLSVPEVYSGSDFTLYLHVKNPFAQPVWIKSVELSLPTQLSVRQSAGTSADHVKEKVCSYTVSVSHGVASGQELDPPEFSGRGARMREIVFDEAGRCRG
jgi:hypothetical protein